MVSPDGSVTALTIGRLASTVGSAMPVSCVPFMPWQLPNGLASAVEAAASSQHGRNGEHERLHSEAASFRE